MGKKISVHNQRTFSEYTAEKKRVEQYHQQHREDWNRRVAQQQRRPRGRPRRQPAPVPLPPTPPPPPPPAAAPFQNCNCRYGPDTCPMGGDCVHVDVVY